MDLPPRILHVEDDQDDALLVSINAGKQFLIHLVPSLADAIKALELDTYDVILLDLGLPDSQGLNTLQKIMEIPHAAAVVVLTGQNDIHTGQQAVSMGATDYLIKSQLATGQLLANTLHYALVYQQQRIAQEKHAAKNDEWHLAAASNKSKRLRYRDSESYQSALAMYCTLLEKLVETRSETLTSQLFDELSTHLSTLLAEPADLIELHANALRQVMDENDLQRDDELMFTERKLLLNMMVRIGAKSDSFE